MGSILRDGDSEGFLCTCHQMHTLPSRVILPGALVHCLIVCLLYQVVSHRARDGVYLLYDELPG